MSSGVGGLNRDPFLGQQWNRDRDPDMVKARYAAGLSVFPVRPAELGNRAGVEHCKRGSDRRTPGRRRYDTERISRWLNTF
jgi:hypothetical protein